MSTQEIIENRISYLKKRLHVAKGYQKYSLADLKTDTLLLGAVERELYVIAQAIIDLAEAIVAFKNFRKPTTMREAFDILGEEGILPKDFLEKFVGIVGFRNALAHDYEDLKLEVVYDVLQNKLREVEEFIVYIQEVA